MKQDRRSTLRAAAATAVLALLVTGCGSTVQTRSAGTLTQDGLGGAVATDGGLSATQDGASVGSAGGGGAQPQGAVATGGGPGQGGSAAGGAAAQGVAPTTAGGGGPASAAAASSKAPIRMGIITQPQLEKTAKTFGLDGVTTGDTRRQAEAVIAWIHAHGDLGGRPIQVFEYQVDMSDGSNDRIQNNACTAMAQDYKVQFVVTVLASLQTLATCLQKAGIGLLADNTNFGDKTMKQFASILGNPSEMGQGRMMTTLVDALVKRGWLTPASKVGILALDGPDGHATVDGPLTAVLRRHGLKTASTVYINPNTGDGGSSQSSSAVLKFRSDAVDKVIPVMYSPLYFMIAAENQGYRPAYAMVSAMGPGALIEGLAPRNQLKNAAGIGWNPYLDIGKGKQPGPVTPRTTLCFELMKKAGQAATSALVKGFQTQVCDMLFYLKDLADRKPSIPADILTSGRLALGKSFVSPATYRVDVSNRTDGVAGYRPLAYLDGCQCFEYDGPLVAIS